MNKVQFEIESAIMQAKTGPTIIRQVCTICKHYLNKWDIKSKKAVCWYCRKKFFPEPQPVEKQPETKQLRLVPQKDGTYTIMTD